MRRAVVPGLAAATAAVAIAACSGGHGGRTGHGELVSGFYEISAYTPGVDGCAIDADPASANGATFLVEVTAGALSIPFQGGVSATGPYGKGVFDARLAYSVDLSQSQTPFDCVLDVGFEFAGASSSTNQADATETWNVRKKAGTGCEAYAAALSAQVGKVVSLPCTSVATEHVARVAPPPREVTGVLTFSTGYGTTLTNVYFSDDTASVLRAHLSVDGWETDFVSHADCYTPAATGTSHYEVGDFSYDFLGQIDAASWAAGPIALGGANLLSIDFVDSAGDEFLMGATGGALMLSAAPTTTGGACSFGSANVPMRGTVYPVAASFGAARERPRPFVASPRVR